MSGRNRSSAFAITDNTKKRMTTEIGLTDGMQDEEKKEKITNYMEEKLKIEYDKSVSSKNENRIEFFPPSFLDIKKEYYSKEEKVFL